LFFLIIFINNASHAYANNFKFYDIKKMPHMERNDYSEKKVYNDLVIKLNNHKGCISISCLPISIDDYKKYFENIIYDDFIGKKEEIKVRFNKKSIKATKINLDADACRIDINSYNNGIDFFISYFGPCKYKSVFENYLENISLTISNAEVKKAMVGLYSTIKDLGKIDIPTYPGAGSVASDYAGMGLVKRLHFYVTNKDNPSKILNYYDKYFQDRGWIPYKNTDQEIKDENILSHIWVDKTEELMITILIQQDVKSNINKNNKRIKNVYINLNPFKNSLKDYCEFQ